MERNSFSRIFSHGSGIYHSTLASDIYYFENEVAYRITLQYLFCSVRTKRSFYSDEFQQMQSLRSTQTWIHVTALVFALRARWPRHVNRIIQYVGVLIVARQIRA